MTLPYFSGPVLIRSARMIQSPDCKASTTSPTLWEKSHAFSSTQARGKPRNIGRKTTMNCRIHRLMLCIRARRKCTKIVSILPIPGWTNRSRSESTSTVGAHIAKHVFNTTRAESAFKRADACLQRIRCKRLVTMLASGPKGESKYDIEVIVGDAILKFDIFFGAGHKKLIIRVEAGQSKRRAQAAVFNRLMPPAHAYYL